MTRKLRPVPATTEDRPIPASPPAPSVPEPKPKTPRSDPVQGSEHPHQNLDRAVRAAVARLSAGVSSHSFIDSWTDWIQHMSQSPGRQL